jgi:flagellar protein FliS
MVNTAYAHNSYTQAKVAAVDNPVDLIIMLYDGAIEYLNKAATGIKIKNLQIKLKYIKRTLAILTELDRSLNFEVGGEIAINLHNLYNYMMKELVLANIHYDVDRLMHISGLLKNLRKGWIEVRNKV